MVMLFALQVLLLACDMSALIMRADKVFSDFNNIITNNVYSNYDVPVDYPAFVMSRSNDQMHNDGYGILYYRQKNYQLQPEKYWYKYVSSTAVANQVYYTGNYFNSNNVPDVFDKAMQIIKQPQSMASIIMCHARNATLNPFAPGNHPFRLDINNRTYTLMHNGYVSYATRTFMINETYGLDNDWFLFHTPNYANFVNAAFPACWIDSEVLFHYLMAHIAAEDFDVFNGMRTALKKLEPYITVSTDVVNFVFSDGERLYAFRSTPTTGLNCSYKLCFRVDSTGFSAFRTGVPVSSETELNQSELVILTDKSEALRYPDYLTDPDYVTHKITNGLPNELTRSIAITPNLNHTGISISFQLEETSRIVINIYNMKGQKVRCLNNSYLPKGSHVIRWDGTNSHGKASARGVYFIELRKNGQRNISKVIYTR